jgi:hypothetical protein
MVPRHSARPRASLPKQFVNFANSTAGLDYTLRLIQALAMVAAKLYHDNAISVKCSIASSQLAFGEFIVHSSSDLFEFVYALVDIWPSTILILICTQ